MAAHYTTKAIRQHIIEYRQYGNTLYNIVYAVAYYKIQSIRQQIIQYRL
jgi:hypothetical protein